MHDIDNMEVRLAIIVSLCNDIESCWKEYQKVIDICKREELAKNLLRIIIGSTRPMIAIMSLMIPNKNMVPYGHIQQMFLGLVSQSRTN